MGRIKTAETVTQAVDAIQFVRAAIGDVYEFNEKRDMTVSFKNDKFSGTIMNDAGAMIPLIGKDWIVKDAAGHIKAYKPEVFEVLFHIIGDK